LTLVLLTATMGTLFSVAKKRGEGLYIGQRYGRGPGATPHRRRDG
jgi:hypothetical protein